MVALVTAGCIRRSLTVRTEPPGAAVYVDDQLKGTAPLTYDFQWYGWHRVTLRKEGYDRLDDRKLLRAPVWMWIPVDLVMELLPFQIRDTRVWSYTLVPMTAMPGPAAPSDGRPAGEPPAQTGEPTP